MTQLRFRQEKQSNKFRVTNLTVKQVQGNRRVSQGEGFNIIAFSVVLRVKINLILIRIWAFDVNIKYKCPFFYSTVTDFARFLG